jgi:hypothetical protein
MEMAAMKSRLETEKGALTQQHRVEMAALAEEFDRTLEDKKLAIRSEFEKQLSSYRGQIEVENAASKNLMLEKFQLELGAIEEEHAASARARNINLEAHRLHDGVESGCVNDPILAVVQHREINSVQQPDAVGKRALEILEAWRRTLSHQAWQSVLNAVHEVCGSFDTAQARSIGHVVIVAILSVIYISYITVT